MDYIYRKKKIKNHIYVWLCRKGVFLLKIYYKFNNKLYTDLRSLKLDSFSKINKDFFVLQIGANDGFDNDPIHKFIMKYNWNGVLVEPQKDVFDNYLTKTYSCFEGIKCLNAALSLKIGFQKMYSISFSKDRWATGLSRFDKESFKEIIDNGYIKNQAILQGVALPKSVEEYIKEVDVETVNFDYIINEYKISKINFLQIDAEGYDFEILKMFPFEKFKPNFINLEYAHFDEETKKQCHILLKKNNYTFREVDYDLFCVLND